MKFICDAMLGHLGKRLRSAGYDTLIDKGTLEDRVLVRIAQPAAADFTVQSAIKFSGMERTRRRMRSQLEALR